MSYDIQFFTKNSNPTEINKDFISDVLNLPNFTYQKENKAIHYNNEDTEVYFFIDCFDLIDDKDGESEELEFEKLFDSGLSVSINFARPSFFGYEALAV